jgi:uncharacterized protein YdhG (YjbR/CyaY superfamily)
MTKTISAKPAKDVDAYLAALPPAERRLLKKLRATIKSVAPKAVEKISYRMPLYFYLGYLVGFAAFKDHCSFFVMSYRVMGMFKKELKPFWKATATLHFTPEKPLPVSLVKKIVKARMKENEVKKKKPSKNNSR